MSANLLIPYLSSANTGWCTCFTMWVDWLTVQLKGLAFNSSPAQYALQQTRKHSTFFLKQKNAWHYNFKASLLQYMYSVTKPYLKDQHRFSCVHHQMCFFLLPIPNGFLLLQTYDIFLLQSEYLSSVSTHHVV